MKNTTWHIHVHQPIEIRGESDDVVTLEPGEYLMREADLVSYEIGECGVPKGRLRLSDCSSCAAPARSPSTARFRDFQHPYPMEERRLPGRSENDVRIGTNESHQYVSTTARSCAVGFCGPLLPPIH